MDDVWNYHAGGERFTTVNVFTDGLTRRYGPATSPEDYERKAQAMAYDGERAMFEAYGRNKTLRPRDSMDAQQRLAFAHLAPLSLLSRSRERLFGTKKAMEPLHVQYDYDNQSVAVVNDTYSERTNMKVRARVYSLKASCCRTRNNRSMSPPMCGESVRSAEGGSPDHDFLCGWIYAMPVEKL